MLTGENGILTQAQRAKNETENAQAVEEDRLDEYEDYINGATGVVEGGEWNEEKGVNTPALKGNMELVRYENGEWVEDKTGSNYSYVAGSGTADNNSSEWANARVTIDGVDSYFVWIPRYEYKIDSDAHTIDVKFIPTSKTQADEGYIIHPAFTNNVDMGGWTSELSGIWIGKYESAREDATSESTGTSTKIKVQPDVISWIRSRSVGENYMYALEYSKSLNSHMLKNSEWGAVAYLTHSQYGRNGTEVEINDNERYITADGDFSENTNQSSTGNVYGIYDLSGGAYERVASYYKNANPSYLEYGNPFTIGVNNKYSTAYEGDNVYTNYIIGDATVETKNWNSDAGSFVCYEGPYFIRGGKYDDGNWSGIFSYGYAAGGNANNEEISGNSGFRLCLVVK